MKLTDDEVLGLLRIVDGLGYGEIRLRFGDLELHVITAPPGTRVASSGSLAHVTTAVGTRAKPSTEPTPTPAQSNGPPPPPPPRPLEAGAAARHVVVAPFAGTFYRGPSPGAPPFVTLEQSVNADDPVCLVEIMKLFQSVPAGRNGRVVAIFVDDGTAVAEEEALFAIEEVSR